MSSPQVGNLAQHGHPKEHLGHLGAWRCVEWVVDKVRNESCKAPVVAAVLEQVCDGHGAMAEPALGTAFHHESYRQQ